VRKDFWKNPDLFFMVLPIAAGLVFYPRSVKTWKETQGQYAEAGVLIEEILQIEPERLHFKEETGQSGEFDYAIEVDRFTKDLGISSGQYTLAVRQGLKQKGKLRRSADLSFKSVKVETAAGFISEMLARWPDLQCEQVTLEKVGTAKNEWNVKLRLLYYY
jgi:hypothetical protein